MIKRILSFTIFLLLASRLGAEPLRITITEGVIEPLPFAAPAFTAENSGGQHYAEKISQLVAQDLSGTGLFREIPQQAHISRITSFASPVQFSDWKAVSAQALIVERYAVQELSISFTYGNLKLFLCEWDFKLNG